MFTLITGVPGSAKTLWLMNHLHEGVKFPNSENYRPIYYSGIPDVNESLKWIKLHDPQNWHEEVPDGSIVIIDEVQEYFPVRSAKNIVPNGLTAIERHRHRGLDVFFITQHPSLLDHHARRLVGQHCHLKRNFGASFSVLYRSNECMDDPKDYHTLKKAERTTFKHPKNIFGLYKSAEVHTHKFRLPKIFYVLILLVLFIICMVFLFINTLFADGSDTIDLNQSSLVSNALTNQTNPYIKQNISIDDFIPQIANTPASSKYYLNDWKTQSVPILSS